VSLARRTKRANRQSIGSLRRSRRRLHRALMIGARAFTRAGGWSATVEHEPGTPYRRDRATITERGTYGETLPWSCESHSRSKVLWTITDELHRRGYAWKGEL